MRHVVLTGGIHTGSLTVKTQTFKALRTSSKSAHLFVFFFASFFFLEKTWFVLR